ncbi:CNT_collapsed_G0014070.mRNA.1.CDS.1 [Saccharomyces cerevisiae]|nr:CNT_collapsed_G0014070.mRNA.1.CDS.1 [Saccharomyces cerevisiae]
MVLVERKKLKAQFPNTSENMNSYSFLDFSLTKLNIFSSMVLTYTSAQREYSQYGLCKGCQKMFRALCLLGWPEKYRIGGWLGKHS